MKHFYQLDNPVMYYDWGSEKDIPLFTGIENERNLPFAELWMGAHPSAPSSIILDTGKHITLDTFLRRKRNSLTGQAHEGSLPFLFKILSAKKPLSLQIHPSKYHAQLGFQDEQSRNIRVHSRKRMYKDTNHKPEIVYALTDFIALCGFRPYHEAANFLEATDIRFLQEAGIVLESTHDYSFLMSRVLALTKIQRKKIIYELIHEHKALPEPVTEVMRMIAQYYPDDVGVLAPLFINCIFLSPGQSIYIPSGFIHAYIKGTGLELMACSDNVLRAAMTSKHIDKIKFLEAMRISPYTPHITELPRVNGIQSIHTEAEEFELVVVRLDSGTERIRTTSPMIALGESGNLHLKSESDTFTLKPGQAVFIDCDSQDVLVSGTGCCYIAKTPERENA